jgi:hypothetical protein
MRMKTVLNITNDNDGAGWYVCGYDQPLTLVEAEELTGSVTKIKELEQRLAECGETIQAQRLEVASVNLKLAEKEKRITFLADKASENYQLAVEAQEESELKDSWVKHHQGSVEATMKKLAESEKKYGQCYETHKWSVHKLNERIKSEIDKNKEALEVMRKMDRIGEASLLKIREFLAKHEIKGSENEKRD